MIATTTTVTPTEWLGGIPEWFGGFFGALPAAGKALYQFGDPSGLGQGWWGIVIVLIWGVGLTAVPLLIAKRTYGTHEWVSATMGVVAALSIGWWVYGIFPSAWIYYLDSSQEILQDTIIPNSVGYTTTTGFLWFEPGYRFGLRTFDTNFYLVVRDTVVVLFHLVGFVYTFKAAKIIQAKYPRGMAEGEVKSDPGGYR